MGLHQHDHKTETDIHHEAPELTNNSDTNKQNHNVQTHKCAASAVYDSTKYYEV